MKSVSRTFRLKTLGALATLIVVSPMAQATLTVTCTGCVLGSAGFATALPAGYDVYEWFVPPPGFAFPRGTATNATAIYNCPPGAFVWVRALDSAGNLLDTGVGPCEP
jgi:hypothetical protein